MITQVDNLSGTAAAPRRGLGLRFSLSSLMFVMLTVAMYFGGRASVLSPAAPRLAGGWQATLPAGFIQPTTIQDCGNGRFLLRSQASIFNGLYEWRDGHLLVVRPDDDRMVGLRWAWDGQKLTLIDEPMNTPTGSSYTGTVLTAPSAKP